MSWEPTELHECEHGTDRRECVRCLNRWVGDLLDTQHWRNEATRELIIENQRLRRLLAEHGVEEPAPKVSPPRKRRPPRPPRGPA